MKAFGGRFGRVRELEARRRRGGALLRDGRGKKMFLWTKTQTVRPRFCQSVPRHRPVRIGRFCCYCFLLLCCLMWNCDILNFNLKKKMRVKMRENWDSIRQSLTKWPNSIRLSIAQAIEERRQEAEDPNHSKIFTFAWPSASSSSSRSSTTRSKVNRSAAATTTSSNNSIRTTRCTFRRCWTQLQRLLFDEEPVPASPSPPGRTN